ncbi:hypothetical protein [Streptomyces sp. NBC_00233]|uniref:hypothetical protein n=1 Tax=Streptomyces sp. NBC_00233 TaxID=2975686 RepID=UPI002255A88A|nr:hypothetical protein [Streptomyces sp. NBC_00233]MCX5233077.1 hypothetical protein [Streptomyces sp. NBC_00233]
MRLRTSSAFSGMAQRILRRPRETRFFREAQACRPAPGQAGCGVCGHADLFQDRHGTAVARVHDGERTEWIFDRQSLEFLGERSVMVKDTPSAKAGQVTATTAVLARTIADRLPEGWERAGAGPGAAPGRAS